MTTTTPGTAVRQRLDPALPFIETPHQDSPKIRMTKLTDLQFSSIADLFLIVSGNRLGADKKAMVESRLSRRLYRIGLRSFDEYLYVLKKFPKQEIPFLINLLTTHHTQFFREKAHFDFLLSELLPNHVKRNRLETFRIWCAASSTGEEAFTLAMLIDGFLRDNGLPPNYEIFATDIDRIAVEQGRRGVFQAEALPGIPARYRLSCIVQEGERFRFRQELLDRIKWSTHNLKDESYRIAYLQKFDAIFARNVFIYFDSPEVEHAASEFTKFLKPLGHLFLGLSEGLPGLKSRYSMRSPSVYQLNEPEPVRAAQAAPVPTSSLQAPAEKKIRVLIVDDSKTIQILLKSIFSGAADIEIVGQAYDGLEAMHILKMKPVDVITSDIHMPNMDGIVLLQEQMKTYRVPTIMISSISKEDGMQFLRASELGAVDYIEKPKHETLEKLSQELIEKVRIASISNPSPSSSLGLPSEKVGTGDKAANRLILIGASTGGPDAINYLLRHFRKDCPPVLIVQHMPAVITRAFAERLSTVVEPEVKEAYDNDFILPGHIYIAPGDRHLGIRVVKGILKVELSSAPPIDQHRPAVDHLFRSALPLAGSYSMAAVLLTGMGRDGAEAMRLLRQAGVRTIAQDKQSSVVYGMARAAVEENAVDDICPLNRIPLKIFSALDRAAKAKGRAA